MLSTLLSGGKQVSTYGLVYGCVFTGEAIAYSAWYKSLPNLRVVLTLLV